MPRGLLAHPGSDIALSVLINQLRDDFNETGRSGALFYIPEDPSEAPVMVISGTYIRNGILDIRSETVLRTALMEAADTRHHPTERQVASRTRRRRPQAVATT